MNRTQEIYRKANKIISYAGTRNMITVAHDLGIKVYFEDSYIDLLGMYTCAYKTRAIFVNNRLDDYMTQMIIAHEIGHDMLHRELAKNGAMKEFELFKMMKNNTEYEANAFASHLLIPTNEFVELSRDGLTIAEIASIMNTEINIALIKCRELVSLGYALITPTDTKGDFMKNIKV